MGAEGEREDTEEAHVEREREPAVAAVASGGPAAGAERDLLARLSKRAWLLLPMLVPVAIVVGLIQGAAAGILVLVGGALIAVIALFWASVRTLLGETPLSGADAYALAAPRAEEEQKQALLRALKDLEFERSVGKISNEDYNTLVTRYRSEAKRLLRALDDEARPRRDRVESLVQERLAAAGIELSTVAPKVAAASTTAKSEAKSDGKKGKKRRGKAADDTGRDTAVTPAGGRRTVEITPLDEAPLETRSTHTDVTQKSEGMTKTKESAAYVPSTKSCVECSTKNDPDAVFCKKCGSKGFATSDAAASPSHAKGDDDGDAKDEEAGR